MAYQLVNIVSHNGMLVLAFSFCCESCVCKFTKKSIAPQVIIGLALVLGWLVYIMSVKNELCYPLAIGSHHFQFHVPFYFGNMFHGLAFYALGSWLREKQFAHGVFIVSMMIFLGKFFFPASMDFRANDTGGSNYFL